MPHYMILIFFGIISFWGKFIAMATAHLARITEQKLLHIDII